MSRSEHSEHGHGEGHQATNHGEEGELLCIEDSLPGQDSSQEQYHSSRGLVMEALNVLKNSEVVRVQDSYFSLCVDQGGQT